jgi:hypothetical protein
MVVLVQATSYGLTSVRLTAASWDTDKGHLFIRGKDGMRAAQFPPAKWAAIIDDAALMPETAAGAMLAARRALAQIADGCRDGWLTDPKRIARIASDGLLELSTEAMP